MQTSGLQPVFGMVGFATGLASPFFFLALFPSYLKKLPKSGGWLMRVKVVMGFVVLAIAMKYLSTVDQVLQTNSFRASVLWPAGSCCSRCRVLYLLGLLRLEGIEAGRTARHRPDAGGALFLIFSISLLPGMFGAPLGELEAYIPVPARSVALAAEAARRPARSG